MICEICGETIKDVMPSRTNDLCFKCFMNNKYYNANQDIPNSPDAIRSVDEDSTGLPENTEEYIY